MDKKIVTVELPQAHGKIKSLQLREPTAGELRGIKMLDLLQMDISAVESLLKRISTPIFTAEQFHSLSLENLTAIMAGLNSFFLGKDNSTADE